MEGGVKLRGPQGGQLERAHIVLALAILGGGLGLGLETKSQGPLVSCRFISPLSCPWHLSLQDIPPPAPAFLILLFAPYLPPCWELLEGREGVVVDGLLRGPTVLNPHLSGQQY